MGSQNGKASPNTTIRKSGLVSDAEMDRRIRALVERQQQAPVKVRRARPRRRTLT